MRTESTRKGPDSVTRLALLLLGLAASAAAVLLRYSPRAITAEDARVCFRLFRPGERAHFAMPVWLLWLIALGLLALFVWRSQTGRRVVAGFAANPRSLSSALVALALLLLTLLPAIYSRTSTSDQSIIVYR
jgi:hypothetical protein